MTESYFAIFMEKKNSYNFGGLNIESQDHRMALNIIQVVKGKTNKTKQKQPNTTDHIAVIPEGQ